MVANVETSIWKRVVDGSWDDLNLEAAKGILRFKFNSRDINRMNKLAALAREGKLTAGQREEMERYNHVGHVLAIMQAKARMVLGRASRR